METIKELAKNGEQHDVMDALRLLTKAYIGSDVLWDNKGTKMINNLVLLIIINIFAVLLPD